MRGVEDFGTGLKMIKVGKIILSLQGCYEIRDNIMSTKKVFNKS